MIENLFMCNNKRKLENCKACHVGQTSRHLKARFSEYRNNTGPVKTRFTHCGNALTEDCIEVLENTENRHTFNTLRSLVYLGNRPKD